MSTDIRTARFQAVAWPHLATVVRAARILCGNAAEAEDLAQETMIKAYRGIDGFADGTDIKAWLLTILRRTRIDRVRATSNTAGQVSIEASGIDPPEPDKWQTDDEAWRENPQAILNSFSDQQVIDALQKLPEDIRLTLLLVDVEQLDHREAATILDVPVGTIKSRTHRGRAMLRQALLPLARDLRFIRDDPNRREG